MEVLHFMTLAGSGTLHLWLLQGWYWRRSTLNRPAQVPAPSAGSLTSRTLVAIPPPHLAEHLDHPPHSARTQLTGHGCRLHRLSADRGRHLQPPSG